MAKKRKNTKTSGKLLQNNKRLASGIPGFDRLCEGGLLVRSINLVTGGAGTGKTIFGMQFLHEGIKRGEKGLFISFEEDLEDLKGDAENLGWDFTKCEENGMCAFLYYYPYELEDFQTRLISEVQRINAKRVVIDSTSAFGMAFGNEYEIRKALYSLSMQLKKLECTAIITSEIVGEVRDPENRELKRISRFNVEEFVCDSVIILDIIEDSKKCHRSIEILKMRRTAHRQGEVPMLITKSGIIVKG